MRNEALEQQIAQLSPVKRHLLARYLEEDSYDTGWLDDFVAKPPEGSLEEKLASVWAEVLGVRRVGRDHNFFDLGGDSIASLRIVAKAKHHGIRLNPRQLFDHPTVRQLAEVASPAVDHQRELATPDETAALRDEDRAPAPEDFPEAELSPEDLASVLARVARQTDDPAPLVEKNGSQPVGGVPDGTSRMRYPGRLPRALALRSARF